MLGPDLKIYALKKIKLKRLDEKSIEQYTNEIKLLERLQGNPHIIRLVAAEQDLQQRQINVVSLIHGLVEWRVCLLGANVVCLVTSGDGARRNRLERSAA
jgi:serine/threonine protein kinase